MKDTYGAKALPSDDSQLLIVGHDMSFFAKLDEATLRGRSFLLLTNAKNQPKRRANRVSSRRERNQGIPLPLYGEATGNAVDAIH